MRAIFISYRRSDTEGQAGRLFKDLQERFGADAVFMDVVDIEPGRDFRRVIDQQVASCGVLLAMVGPRWLADDGGRRRLDDPSDFVRLETAAALKRDIPVVPVLVQGARMPSAEQLPADISELAYRNAVELTHARWDSDVEVLARALKPYVGPGTAPAHAAAPAPAPAPAATPAPSRSKASPWPIAAAAAAILLAGGGWYTYDRAQREAAEKAEAAKQEALRQEAERARAEAAAAEAAASAAKAAADKAIADKAAADKALAEKAAADQALADKAAADKALADKAAADKVAAAPPSLLAGLRDTGLAVARATELPKVVSYPGRVNAQDPCNGLNIATTGTTTLTITRVGDGVTVQQQYTGSGAGYDVRFAGNGRFDAASSSYDIPIRGQWVGGGSRFETQAIDRIFANPAGAPTGDRYQSTTHRCLRR